MNLKSIFNNILNNYNSNFTIPREYRSKIADTNNLHLLKILPLVFIYGIVISLITLLFVKTADLKTFIIQLVYDITFILYSGLGYLWSKSLVSKEKYTSFERNLPSYIIASLFMTSGLIKYILLQNTMTGFIIFTTVACIMISFFSLDCLFFTVLCTIITLAMSFFEIFVKANIHNFFSMTFFLVILVIVEFIRTKSTIKSLSQTGELEERDKTLQKEIELATFIQKSFYTHAVPELKDYEISFYNKPMAGVSGDLYDVYYHEKILDGLGIFDVSGHGISSGLVTMLVKNIITNEFYSGIDDDLKDVITNINERVIAEKGDIENYLTGILIRMKGDKIELINVGHEQPLIYSKKKNQCYFYENKYQKRFGVIGIADFPVSFEPVTLSMESGDELLLFTDGITEAINKQRVSFGKERLIESFEKNIKYTLSEQLNTIVSSLDSFRNGEIPNDDVTMVIIRKL